MYNLVTRSGYLSNEISNTDQPLAFDRGNTTHIPRVFVICDRTDTAPVWGYILREQGLRVVLESSPDRAVERWTTELPDLFVIDIDSEKRDPVELYRAFRAVSTVPILLFFPTHHETRILEAYAAGVDEVVVKPISPPIFLAKIMAWVRRSWIVPADDLNLLKTGKYRLDPARRSFTDSNDIDIKLTNLEFRLLHLLMGLPGNIFFAEEIIQAIWGGYGSGDPVMLKNVVYRLRKKIESDPARPEIIQTGPGGYSFNG